MTDGQSERLKLQLNELPAVIERLRTERDKANRVLSEIRSELYGQGLEVAGGGIHDRRTK